MRYTSIFISKEHTMRFRTSFHCLPLQTVELRRSTRFTLKTLKWIIHQTSLSLAEYDCRARRRQREDVNSRYLKNLIMSFPYHRIKSNILFLFKLYYAVFSFFNQPSAFEQSLIQFLYFHSFLSH